MNITLRAGERLYLNGAVIRTDRKTTIELLNDATFLLETHVMQAADATTPLRQIYFVIQVMLMDPGSAKTTAQLARSLIDKSLEAFDNEEIKAALARGSRPDEPRPLLRGDEDDSRACTRSSRSRCFRAYRKLLQPTPPERIEHDCFPRHRRGLRAQRRPTTIVQHRDVGDESRSATTTFSRC